MDINTLLIYSAMYVYGFSLMIWAIYFDKRPTKLSVKAAKFGCLCLILTMFYTVYVLATRGITP